jgi:hypothetical protein
LYIVDILREDSQLYPSRRGEVASMYQLQKNGGFLLSYNDPFISAFLLNRDLVATKSRMLKLTFRKRFTLAVVHEVLALNYGPDVSLIFRHEYD